MAAESALGSGNGRPPTMEDLKTYAKMFSKHRIELGLSQRVVGVALGDLFGQKYQPSTICRFEACRLKYQNMWRLKSLLETFLELLIAVRFPLNVQKSKSRSNLEPSVKSELEEYFKKQPRPSKNERAALEVKLQLDGKVLRTWFINRRIKDKRKSTVALQSLLNSENDAAPNP